MNTSISIIIPPATTRGKQIYVFDSSEFLQKNPLPNGKGFEASFDENSRFTQLFKVRSCVTIECRPPQRKRLQRSQSTHRINLVYHEHPQTVKKVSTCFLLEYSKEITALDSGR